MKNKINKVNKTKFDYFCRKCLYLGVAILVFSFVIGMPLMQQLSNSNVQLTQQVDDLEGQRPEYIKVDIKG